MSSAETAILLATYNGGRFLLPQLESIAGQTDQDFHLFARDDGSTDETVKILRQFQQRFPDKVTVLSDQQRNLGASANFGSLLQNALAASTNFRYFAFSDQDDVWLPHKLEATLAAIRAVESGEGSAPILAHSDLIVVDDTLAQLAPSFWAQQGFIPGDYSVTALVFRNMVTGCAMVINRALASRALPIPNVALMHDWWIALVAAATGRIIAVPAELLYYRQHATNTFGAGRYLQSSHRLLSVHHWRQRVLSPSHDFARRACRQAGAIRERFGEALSADECDKLSFLSLCEQAGPLRRRICLIRSGLLPPGLVRKLSILVKL